MCLRIFNSRKAMSMGILLILLLTLAGALVLGSVTYTIYKYMLDENDDAKCMMSLFAASQTQEIKRKTDTLVDIVPAIDCPVKEVEIKVKDVTYSRGGSIVDERMKRIYADQLVRCWDMVGKGKNNPHGSIGITDKSVCLICSKIYPSKELTKRIKKENYKMKDFLFFLATTPAPKKDITYYEYLYSPSNPVSREFLLGLKESEGSRDVSSALYVNWRFAMDVSVIDTLHGGSFKKSSQLVDLLALNQMTDFNMYNDDHQVCEYLLNG